VTTYADDATPNPAGRAPSLAPIIDAITVAATTVADLLATGGRGFGRRLLDRSGGDAQSQIDVLADELFAEALADAGANSMASEERVDPVELNARGTISVAIDPIDGSSNVPFNGPSGTIFSLFDGGSTAFFGRGSTQRAAGIVLYGPAITMALTTGDGTDLWVLDRANHTWRLQARRVAVARETRHFAINMSNRRFWEQPVRRYVDELIAGVDGPRGADFNMRWVAAVAADAHRILGGGGTYLYPRDDRSGYGAGRLRLLYEAFPIAMLMEQAGGAATDGVRRILDLSAGDLHQRTPLAFGSAAEIERLAQSHLTDTDRGERAPLFATRGLFRS
jgi:fructose-1,6-bisphosphatase I